jgi:hypothetical protein
VANLPLDTAITITIDATDANGNPTPDFIETVTGVVNASATELVSCIRGLDDTTAQSHATGANVVQWFTATDWNDFITAFLTQHSQQGAHVAINNTGGLTNTDGLTTDTLDVTDTSVFAGAMGGAGYSMATMSNPCKFSAYRAAAYTFPANSGAVVPYDTVLFDTGSNVNLSTGVFTATVAGFYWFNASVNVYVSGNNAYNLYLDVNDGAVSYSLAEMVPTYAGFSQIFSGQKLVYLSEGETVEVSFNNNQAAGSPKGNLGTGAFVGTLFEGYLLCET